ncbi:alpha-1,2-fucosyltransferase [Butyrivibrio fibrisolvens]|uniref:alpha-1,2-fucosyltransferase n=1 Tax=Butyrivibrio fibrisolvens TaxID=831 RepID=UPI0020C10A57|nr:alpha-1,2-fucosyltransferase [Butyrivibrio fibrisolvens]
MIYVDMRGNLGNQLFDYALARAISEKTGDNICLNTYYLHKYKPQYTFNLEYFNLPDNVEIVDDMKFPFGANSFSLFSKIARKVAPNIYFSLFSKFGIYVWLRPEYKKIDIANTKNHYVVGYWQSPKYLNGIEDILRKEIVPNKKTFEDNKDVIERNKDLFNIIQKTESVCISIRRGDYISDEKNRKNFYICDEKYFKEAMERINADVPNAVFIMFSDDIEWVKNNIDVGNTQTYYESGKDPVWEKLRLMSSCKHFILSNSTFSWWAEYLSQNSNKIVYAPDRWFPTKQVSDLYESYWKKILV